MRGRSLPPIVAGSIIGQLMVIEPATQLRESGRRRYGYNCQCDCDTVTFVDASKLLNGKTTRCRECADANRGHQAVTHGLSKTPGYSNWRRMNARCLDKHDPNYKNYGKKGIAVCERWRRGSPHAVQNFFADLGPRPSPKHSLDRFPNRAGNYEPSNVRWATATEQNRNKDSNVLLTVDDVTLTLGEWAERAGIDRQTLWARHKLGMDDKKAVTMPVRAQITSLTIDGVTCAAERWAQKAGVDFQTVQQRLAQGCGSKLAVFGAGLTVAIDDAGDPSAVLLDVSATQRDASSARSFVAKNGYPITIDGVTRSQFEWARIGGVAIGTIRRRLKLGLSPRDAVFHAPDQGHGLNGQMRNQNRIDCVKLTVDAGNGALVTKILSEWARERGLSESCIRNRIAQGWNHTRAVMTPSRKRVERRSVAASVS